MSSGYRKGGGFSRLCFEAKGFSPDSPAFPNPIFHSNSNYLNRDNLHKKPPSLCPYTTILRKSEELMLCAFICKQELRFNKAGREFAFTIVITVNMPLLRF